METPVLPVLGSSAWRVDTTCHSAEKCATQEVHVLIGQTSEQHFEIESSQTSAVAAASSATATQTARSAWEGTSENAAEDRRTIAAKARATIHPLPCARLPL